MIRTQRITRRSRVAEGVRGRREERFERMQQESQVRAKVDSTDWRLKTVNRLRNGTPPQYPRY